MNHFPSRFGALALVLVAGLGLGSLFRARDPQTLFLSRAAAQGVDAAPAISPGDPAGQPVQSVPAAAQKLSAGMIHTDAKGRHLAPRDTFYLLTYVSATTDKGVEGFEPGQEVHLVEVHRPTQTLVVSDGRASVEVSPSKLTNDMDIAVLVRRKDVANQTQIAAYIQSEEAAYSKAEREAADATAKDIQHHEQEQAAESRVAPQPEVQPSPQQIDTSVGNASNGYYGYGGYGYGSPYSYFSGGSVVVVTPKTPATAPAAAAPAAAEGKAAAPAAHAGGGRPK